MAKEKKPAGGAATIEGEAQEVKKTKKRTSPIEFLQQVRDEARKVTWTSRNETLVSTIMVLIMVAIMAAFFFGVDLVLRTAVQAILRVG